jgi:hypothetical protein
MMLTLRALLLVLFISVCAEAQTRTLAVYGGSAQGLDAEARFAMRAEVQRLLAPAGFAVVWKGPAERNSGEDFEQVAVASFEGSCSASALTLTSAATTLADTSITDGRILPFFHVDCPRVIQMLGPQAEPSVVGRALGRVIAHEIYHIVAHTADHHDRGVAKAVFSTHDLTNPRFEFDAWSVSRMQPPSIARTSETSEGAAGR